MYKGIGPNKLGSPLKQTTKTYPDLPQALKSDAVKKDFKQYQSDYMSSQNAAWHQFRKNTMASGALTPSYPETFFMGGGIVKGLFKGAQPTFNIAKSAAPAWKSTAATIGGAVADDVIIGGVDYIISGNGPSNNINNKNKKNKK